MILINGEPQQKRAKAHARPVPANHMRPKSRAEIVRALIEKVDVNGWGGRWNGATIVCIASGPSLTADDAEYVRRWREGGGDRRVIVVNTTFKSAPWADVLFAMDRKWWNHHARNSHDLSEFAGERVSIAAVSGAQKVQHPSFKHFGNSGTGAIALAAIAGAARIILLGYDCQRGPNGEVHHFGDHPPGLGNALSMPTWMPKFENCARALRRHNIINCSRATALTCWPRAELSEALS